MGLTFISCVFLGVQWKKIVISLLQDWTLPSQRKKTKPIKPWSNLIDCLSLAENVLRTALSMYMDREDVALPLPTHEEVLVCSETTTTEEVGNLILRPLVASFIDQTTLISLTQVTLLWQRAIDDPGFKRIFCLLHAEKLAYQVCHKAIQSLTELSQGRKQGE